MKKLIFIIPIILLLTNITYAQLPVKPSLQIGLKGAYSLPLSHQEYKDYTSGYPGVQLEAVYDINSQWGIYGNFSADFITAKNSSQTSGTITGEQYTSTRLIGFVGPRYYVPATPMIKVFFDAGIGLYALTLGDQKFTNNGTNPPTSFTYSYTSVSQTGLNLGTGVNISAGSNMVVTFGAKYHFILKKTDASLTQTSSTGISREITGDIPEQSYLQLSAGIGYRFGL